MTAKVAMENEFSTTHFSFGGKSQIDFSIAENWKMTAKVAVENEFSTTLHFSFSGKSQVDFSIAKNWKMTSPWWKNELWLLFASTFAYLDPEIIQSFIETWLSILRTNLGNTLWQATLKIFKMVYWKCTYSWLWMGIMCCKVHKESRISSRKTSAYPLGYRV